MIKLFTLPPSGSAQKVRIALRLLALPFEEISLVGGKHKEPAFLAINPLGQVPVLIDGDVVLRDSGAILVYLAARYRPGEWDGHDAGERGRIGQWLMLTANEVFNGPAALRVNSLFGTAIDRKAATATTEKVLGIVERQLEERDWIEGERLTIADLALAPYFALAPQGGVDIEPFSNIRSWVARIADLPTFPAMTGWAPTLPKTEVVT
jgi:glutathione S-transferase